MTKNYTQTNPRGLKYAFTCFQKRHQTNLRKEQDNLFYNIDLNYNLEENQKLNKKNTSIWDLIFNFILNLFNFK